VGNNAVSQTAPSSTVGSAQDDARGKRVSLVEIALVSCIVIAGAGVRGAFPERMAVEHFDEGVYASNWFCRPPGLPDHTFPQQHLYAPPLMPALFEWVLILTGSNAHAVMWVNVVFGTLTIPLVWWIARDWFGPIAGLLAATFAAFSDLHIFFSRMALTDVPLVLFMAAGVWTGVRGIVNGRPLWIALSAGFAALAWWTKYNGWLTLAITGAGLAGWLLFGRPQGVSWRTLVMRWLAIAALTCVFWSPAWWDLQDVGGYSAVAENHARYVVGPGGWLHSLAVHLDSWQAMGSWAGVIAFAVGALLAMLASKRGHTDWSSSPATWPLGETALVLGAACLAAACGEPSALFVLTLAALPRLILQDVGASPVVERGPGARLGLWTSLAWIAGLGVSTPLYTPYPRLGLPLNAGLWLTAAAFASPLLHRGRSDRRRTLFWLGMLPAVGAFLAVALWFRFEFSQRRGGIAWEDRRGLQAAAPRFVRHVEIEKGKAPPAGRVDAVFYVYAEPALFYHLSAIERRHPLDYLVQPIGDLGLLQTGAADSNVETWLIVGPHATAADWKRLDAAADAGKLQRVMTLPYDPSSAVSLDQFAWGAPSDGKWRLYLYRVNQSG
jgi:4-amino-4-deoxy-L-arabinose transferase-like glycosyltransferase